MLVHLVARERVSEGNGSTFRFWPANGEPTSSFERMHWERSEISPWVTWTAELTLLQGRSGVGQGHYLAASG